VAAARHARAYPRDGWFWLAATLWAASVLVAIAVVAIDLTVGPAAASPAGLVLQYLVGPLGLLAFTTVGAAVAWRLPRNPVGWLLLADGLVWLAGTAVERYVGAVAPLGPGAAVVAALADSAGWVAGLGLIGLVLLLFPTGRLPGRRWRAVWWLVVGGGASLALALLLTPDELAMLPGVANPFGVGAAAGAAAAVELLARPTFFTGITLAVASPLLRFRGAAGRERQQLRWLAFAVLLMLAGFAIGALLTAVGLPGEPWFNTVPMFTVPIAIAIAVTRYRLWDLDLIIDRTATYGLLALLVTACYVVLIAGLGALIGGRGSSDVWLAVLATAVAAALFQPAREAIQTGVARVLFPPRQADPEQAPVVIRTLGGFHVERAGRPVPASEWRSKKARVLLKLLVANRGRPVHRERLIETLWPGDTSANLANRLAVAVSTLRAVLDPEKRRAGDHYVAGDAETVRLDLGKVSVDVEEFLRAAETSLAQGGAALAAAEELYQGDFLEADIHAEWSQALRDRARAAYLAVLRAQAVDEVRRGPDAAVAAQLKILEVDPWDEDAHREIVAALTSAGRHGEARQAYRRYRARMHELGLTPEPY
jgi:DNA-binding SARP family transcriptional activator